MISLLARLFIPDRHNYADAGVRRAWGVLCSLSGIALGVLLFAAKYLAGALSGSVAVTADAVNSLSDAGSSLITLLGFRLAGKRPDSDHPFGHGRIEYLSGVAVSAVIIAVGLELGRSSVMKILSPGEINASPAAMLALAASIGVKFYMYRYNRAVGGRIGSPAMSAAAADSLSDCAATGAVLLSMLSAGYLGVNVDGWCGAGVSLFIMYSGLRAAADALSPLLGRAPDPAFVRSVRDIVMSRPEVVNVHDIVVHDYGPGRLMVSLHAEVPGDGDIYELHDAIDTAEYELGKRLGCEAVIHMDPISVDDGKVAEMRARLERALREVDGRVTIHDFRIVDGPTHTNVIFDALLPADLPERDEDVKRRLEEIVRSLWENSHPKVHIDRDYAGLTGAPE